MTKDENVMLVQMASDIGYVKGMVTQLVDAKVIDRLSAVEAANKGLLDDVEEIKTKSARRIGWAIAAVACVGGLASASVAVITLVIG